LSEQKAYRGRLEGRVAIITGSATGIGRAFATVFAEEGADVVIADINAEEAAITERQVRAHGREALVQICDVTQPDQVQAMVDATVARFVISPPLRAPADRDALWAGLAAGDLDLVATDHVPDRVAVEKADASRGVPFHRISNGAPGIETLLAILNDILDFSKVESGRMELEDVPFSVRDMLVDALTDDHGLVRRAGRLRVKSSP